MSRAKQPRARRADAIAGSDGQLAALLRQTRAWLALNQRLADVFPANGNGEIGIARVDGDCLVIAAASPARATQARNLAGRLLAEARRHWPGELTRARVIVAPGFRLDPEQKD
ncbi:MAG: DciA family protein [Wenzhouxiangellaceae bacterium]|nr:DciA family protein [Wenzhouxiangellaceae bacterium]